MVKDKGTETKEGTEAVKEAKKYFGKSPDLKITDVPTKALNQFQKLANEEFKPKNGSAHYGFTLKYLLDFYFGKITEHSLIAEAKADEALERIKEIEAVLEQQSAEGTKDPKVKTNLEGKEMRCF